MCFHDLGDPLRRFGIPLSVRPKLGSVIQVEAGEHARPVAFA